EICLRFGIELPPGVSKPALLVMLEKHLVSVRQRGEKAVLMMDEAQNLSMDLLEEIRLLSNLEHKGGDKLLQIFLVGQPELEAHLARHELRQLRQRITVHYRLNPLGPEESMGYIHHHINVAGGNGPMVFPADTCREIYRLSHGIPREINTLASSALIAAYADGSPSVRLDHIATVAHEGDFRSVLANARPEPAPAPPPRVVAPPPPPAPAMPASQQPAAPAPRPRPAPAQPPDFTWPPLPQFTPSPGQSRASASPPPPPPAPPAPPQPEVRPAPRESRSEITRGLMAAMRRAETPEPTPPQAPAARRSFASRPAPVGGTPASPPAPIPLPTRGQSAQPSTPMPPHLGALGPQGAPVIP